MDCLKYSIIGSGNYSTEEVDAWIERLERIRPGFVHVYSLDRNTPAKDLRQLSKAELDLIADRIRCIGLQAEAFIQ